MPLPASLPTIRALKDAAIGGLLFALTLWLLKPGVEKGSPVIVDDGYYYLQIARNVARGAGSTFDGINATNGYHPLWLLTLVPLYRMIPNDSTGAVHAALVVQALLASGSVFLLYQAARLTMGWSGSIIAVVLWMGISFRMSLSGLEYGLSVFFVAMVAWYYLKRFRSNKSIPSKWCYLILGLLLSGAVLSRLDNAFLAMFIGCGIMGSALRKQTAPGSRVGLLVFLAPLVLILSAYFGNNVGRFGALMPISGAVKAAWSSRMLQSEPGYSESPVKTTVLAKARNLIWPFERLRYSYAVYTAVACFLAPAYWLLVRTWSLMAKGNNGASLVRPLRGWGFFLGAALLQYACYALWFHGGITYGQPWYYVMQPMMGTLVVGMSVDQIFGWLGSQKEVGGSWRNKARRPAAEIGGVVVLGYVTWITLQQIRAETGAIQQLRLPEVIRWLRQNTPPDAVVGAWNAGTLGYFSDRRVINLDGLVNSRKFHFQHREALCSYFDEVGIDYIADYMTLEGGPAAFLPLAYTYPGLCGAICPGGLPSDHHDALGLPRLPVDEALQYTKHALGFFRGRAWEVRPA